MESREIQQLYQEAENHLITGDNSSASKIYKTAADKLTALTNDVSYLRANPPSGVTANKLYLQAAHALSEAGLYADSHNMLMNVDLNVLDKKWRDIYKSLSAKVGSRRSPSWMPSRQRELADADKQKKWNKVIRILADCPYLVLPKECAEMRARACRGLGNIDAAILFEKDAERMEKAFTKTTSGDKVPPGGIIYGSIFAGEITG